MSPRAFTLAEVLITLGIVGVIAAITLPNLVANYQKKVTATRLKKVYSNLYNAYNSAELEYGSSENWDYPQTTENFTVENFWNKYFAPYIRTEKYTKNYSVKNLNGDNAGYIYSHQRQIRYKTTDGTCITIWNNNQFLGLSIDLNCSASPNVIGKDIFDIVELYWAGKKFKLFGLPKNEQERKSIINSCSSHTYVGGAPAKCFGVFVYDNWEFKEDYPWK